MGAQWKERPPGAREVIASIPRPCMSCWSIHFSHFCRASISNEMDGFILRLLHWMSTKTEPYQKYLAHDEKSKFFLFFPEIAYGKPRTWCDFFLKYFFIPQKNQKYVTVPRLVKNTQNSVTNTLSKTSLCLIRIKITLQFEPGNLFLRSLQVFWSQLYFCGLIFKATTSRLKSLKFAS